MAEVIDLAAERAKRWRRRYWRTFAIMVLGGVALYALRNAHKAAPIA